MRWGWSLGDKGELEVVDDFIHTTASRTDHGIDLIDLTDHLDPALGRDGPELLLDNGEGGKRQACLLNLPSMSVCVQAEVPCVLSSKIPQKNRVKFPMR